ncbi:hypothetical protein LDJ79_00375 [Vibrio tritonius]|uniref:Uncharacterized protein n=1 Tax=Vibrio tritonius TaxID=1435069 RepID=A0ABS7YFU9_9VIBR|nr:hypothetical protein [Vibrio tritonius]MCA2014543.1 hypothetical protein [Vibrio tritonius]
MNRYGLIVYWLGCLYVVTYLLRDNFVLFYDQFSLVCTFVPAICSLFIRKDESTNNKLLRFFKVSWVSAGLTTMYGTILVMSQIPLEAGSLVVGFSVAMLPIFYAFLLSLVIVPFVIDKR